MPWIAIRPRNEYETFVDDEDVHLLDEYSFFFDGRYVKWRKAGKRNGPDVPRDPATVLYLHRLILVPPEGMFTDHADGNTLNNSRSNLRVCTKHQNGMNRMSDGGIIDRTVFRPNTSRPYGARIMHNYKHINLGSYETEEEARAAVAEARKKYRGDFAVDMREAKHGD